ncbi:hypothetical protein GGP41_003231 [Bipolaris sorokiniana]|uniref:Uncharacterized protein n=1 Tax=Cochliobolus sativus TaxID=45130 RepID=A0A8H5ZFK0_COCSA|nr:hypothetical protein GGP41_003231 [Bipolaris sorokiniana]
MDEFFVSNENPFDNYDWISTTKQQPLVYQLRSTLATNAKKLNDAKGSSVVLMAYDYEKGIIDAEKDDVVQLVQDWKFPKAVVQSLLTRGVPRGFHRRTDATNIYFWYYITTSRPKKDMSMYDFMRVCTVYDTTTSFSRTLVFCPQSIIGKAREALQIACNAEPNTNTEIEDWAIPHLFIAHLCIKEWENEEGRVRRSANNTAVYLNYNADKIVGTEPIEIIDRQLHRVYWSMFYSSTLDIVISHLRQEFEMFQVYRTCPTTKIFEILDSFSAQMDSTRLNFEFFKNYFNTERQKFLDMITLKNAGYTQRNTIALRRIAESSSEDAQEMKRQSQQALESSKLMMKISYLSMFYLPGTFLATLFSTPFFQINQELQFPALTKLWIYFIFAAILTTFTFLASTVWDIIRDWSNNPTDKQANLVLSTKEEGDNYMNPDRSLFSWIISSVKYVTQQ